MGKISMRGGKFKNKEMMRIKQHPVKQIRVCYCKQWINEWVEIRHCEIIQKNQNNRNSG